MQRARLRPMPRQPQNQAGTARSWRADVAGNGGGIKGRRLASTRPSATASITHPWDPKPPALHPRAILPVASPVARAPVASTGRRHRHLPPRENLMRIVSAALVAAALAVCPASAQTMGGHMMKKSLYERLGGIDAIR